MHRRVERLRIIGREIADQVRVCDPRDQDEDDYSSTETFAHAFSNAGASAAAASLSVAWHV